MQKHEVSRFVHTTSGNLAGTTCDYMFASAKSSHYLSGRGDSAFTECDFCSPPRCKSTKSHVLCTRRAEISRAPLAITCSRVQNRVTISVDEETVLSPSVISAHHHDAKARSLTFCAHDERKSRGHHLRLHVRECKIESLSQWTRRQCFHRV